MSLLPVVREEDSALTILEPQTGEQVALNEASPRALLEAQQGHAERRRDEMLFGKALAAELAHRYGYGTKDEAGYGFKVEVTRSWQKVGTIDALHKLKGDGLITDAEFADAAPAKRVPDARKCKALVERLMLSGEVEAAKALADTCSVSDPRVSSIVEEALRGEVA